MMKKILAILILLLNYAILFGSGIDLKLKSQSTDLKIKENSYYTFKFSNSIAEIKTQVLITKKGSFANLEVNGYIRDYSQIGKPQLPVLNKLIEIPQDATVEINIISYDEEIINLADFGITDKLNPIQPSISKGIDGSKVKFYIDNDAYSKDEYTNKKIVDVIKLGTMRGVILGRLKISPVQYNPVKNIIKVYNNIVVEVKFKNANVAKTISTQKRFYSPYFESTYSSIINYKKGENKDLILSYPVKYVIVADTMFYQALQPFVRWKIRKGFNVVQAYTSNPSVGNTTTSISSYLNNLYNSASLSNPAPSFVLFVGDITQVPPFTCTQGHASDFYYCEYTGDTLPDVYYGRFSANNLTELQPQIDKTLEYEQYLMPNPSYLDSVVMIAGVDNGSDPVNGGNSIPYANGQINYGVNTYFNSGYGIYSNTYVYPQTNDPNVALAIKSKLSTGPGFANYTAHGGVNGWVNPSFNTSDIANMSNAHKYALWIGNCCLTNSFDKPNCFGVELLRAANKGAIGYIGASNNSFWDEDYYFAVGNKVLTANPVYDPSHLGLFDRTFHSHGESYSEWYASQGQSIFAGNLAVVESGSTSAYYYWEIYHLMGDPSLMPYYSVPIPLTATYANPIVTGTTTLQVNTLPGAYVAISHNNVLLDARLANNSGNVTLTFTPFANPDTADIVVTAQNCSPFVGTVRIISNNIANIVLSSYSINDSLGNNNLLADFNENIKLNITLMNNGLVAGNNVTVKLRTTDSYIQITDSTESFGNIAGTSSATQNNAFSLQVSNFIPDQHLVTCNVEIKDALDSIWYASLTINLNAPILIIPTVLIDDSTGNNNKRLDNSENVKICITVNNNGNSSTPLSLGVLSSTSQYITIANDSLNNGTILPNGSTIYKFDVNVDSSAPLISSADFNFIISANPYFKNKSFILPINAMVEDWESGAFTNFPWTNVSPVPWTIDTAPNVYEGSYSSKSGAITNNQTTELSFNVTLTSPDSISFYKKVSCEKGYSSTGSYLWYDFLEFSINNVTKGKWDGIINWSRESYYLPAGTYILKWAYSKDDSDFEGSDCVWIDMIVIQPSITSVSNISSDNSKLLIYPNPFSDETNIQYTLTKKSNVSLVVLDNLGREVELIVNNNQQAEGTYNYKFLNHNLSQGIYHCKLIIDNKSLNSKMVILNNK